MQGAAAGRALVVLVACGSAILAEGCGVRNEGLPGSLLDAQPAAGTDGGKDGPAPAAAPEAGACPEGQPCDNTCPAGTNLCGGICVPVSSVSACGASCLPCRAPNNAEPRCENGSCAFRCLGGFHRCDDQCRDDLSVESCGDRCDPCPIPGNATPTCDGNSCGFSCNPGTYRCNDGCIPGDRPCNGACPGGLKLCGSGCFEGDCCPGDSCGPCRSCQNNRCQNTQDGVPGPGCSGTCRECNNGSCRNRPNSKACGARCVSDQECCEACGACRSCIGGSCAPDDDEAGCNGCNACQGGACRPNDDSCRPPANADPICQANGSCDFTCRRPFVRAGNQCVQPTIDGAVATVTGIEPPPMCMTRPVSECATTRVMLGRCNGRAACEVQAGFGDNGELGPDPCVQIVKEVRFDWRCAGATRSTSVRERDCAPLGLGGTLTVRLACP
jgi:hypothetical protein